MDVIQSITRVHSRVCYELDTGEKFWLTKSGAASLPVREGEEVDPEQFRKAILHIQYPAALNAAVAMLARRACSRGEIEAKLKQSLYSEDTIEMVLYKLEKEKLTNDQEFTQQWVQYRSGKNLGPHRIYQELRRKGISEEDAREAVESMDEDSQMEQAAALAKKALLRARPGEDARKSMQRALSALVRRGYSWDFARDACEHALEEMKDE